jgi:hypothetical protein
MLKKRKRQSKDGSRWEEASNVSLNLGWLFLEKIGAKRVREAKRNLVASRTGIHILNQKEQHIAKDAMLM